MVNDLNEKRSNAVIIAAIVTTLVIIVGGLVSGLVLAVRRRGETSAEKDPLARFLLVDSAQSLMGSMSALRLCNEEEPAADIGKTALVFAVRAETALECDGADWEGNRSKESFLNDVATVLHTYDVRQTIEMSDMLYEYSAKFYDSVTNDTEFDYNGELTGGATEEEGEAPTQAQIDAAAARVEEALGATAQFVGAWNGHLEFGIERDGGYGYAIVCGDKIPEFSFMREQNVEDADADYSGIALDCARKCGYDGLTVRYADRVGSSVAVIMCKELDGALACDGPASAVVYGGKVVAFSAGDCDCEHNDVPKAKRSEAEARRAAPSG
ncbi:MAG: hypothetical protein NC184_07205, partial [Roseburia sp.]|nr:hypothetical protein [Roseburia sp.]